MDFFNDFREMFADLRDLLLWKWNSLETSVRVLIALSLAIGLLFIGSKTDKASWGTVLVLGSVGLFAYLIFIGYNAAY